MGAHDHTIHSKDLYVKRGSTTTCAKFTNCNDSFTETHDVSTILRLHNTNNNNKSNNNDRTISAGALKLITFMMILSTLVTIFPSVNTLSSLHLKLLQSSAQFFILKAYQNLSDYYRIMKRKLQYYIMLRLNNVDICRLCTVKPNH